MHPHYRGVAFLLSLGSLPIACGKDPQPTDTDDTGNGPTPNTSDVGASTTDGPGATTTTGTTGPADPTTGPVVTSTTDPQDTETPVTTFLTTNTTTEGTDDTGPPVFPPPENPICQAYADKLVECYPRYAPYANLVGYYCDQYIKEGMRLDGPACVDAIEAMYACFNAIPCGMPPDREPCVAESMAVDAACPNTVEDGIETSGTDTDPDTSGSSTG